MLTQALAKVIFNWTQPCGKVDMVQHVTEDILRCWGWGSNGTWFMLEHFWVWLDLQRKRSWIQIPSGWLMVRMDWNLMGPRLLFVVRMEWRFLQFKFLRFPMFKWLYINVRMILSLLKLKLKSQQRRRRPLPAGTAQTHSDASQVGCHPVCIWQAHQSEGLQPLHYGGWVLQNVHGETWPYEWWIHVQCRGWALQLHVVPVLRCLFWSSKVPRSQVDY